jgi:alanyl-tRNA synthetase
MKSSEIRSTYLKFFADRGHVVHPSDSLAPENDPTLLFTGAGMNQFKDMFMGIGNLPFSRATTTQKCLRLPDLDEVGRTPSHHTFFEMLGNFSFGDYFKEEAIAWADELMREGFGLDRSRLVVTVYQDDDEAFDLWRKIGYAKDRIFRYGEKDNFWPAEAPSKGPNGPCGPCSEIYYDFGEGVGEGDEPETNGKRFVEVWNLVFTQFERQDQGKLVPLPQRNIDTGLGLERLVRVLQGGETNFDTDLFQPILQQLGELTGRDYEETGPWQRPMRRVADHIRAAGFCIADGVVPSNERQGYVVRKILRRALADGLDLLGLEGPFLERMVPTVVGVAGMVETFEEVGRNQDKVAQLIGEEEKKFLETYERGRQRLDQELEEMQARGEKRLSGKVAFFLWDTAGFPLDLTRRVLEQRGLELDEAGFEEAMEEQRQKSRAGSNIRGEIFSRDRRLRCCLRNRRFMRRAAGKSVIEVSF